MKDTLDLLFSNFQWYRRLTGDRWHQIELRGVPGVHSAWLRGHPYPTVGETVTGTENWIDGSVDAVYEERDRLLAATARLAHNAGYAVELWRHPEEDTSWDNEWRWIVAIEFPAGQATWHIHDSEYHLFSWLPEKPGRWDGHSTPEKYRRVCEFAKAQPARANP